MLGRDAEGRKSRACKGGRGQEHHLQVPGGAWEYLLVHPAAPAATLQTATAELNQDNPGIFSRLIPALCKNERVWWQRETEHINPAGSHGDAEGRR